MKDWIQDWLSLGHSPVWPVLPENGFCWGKGLSERPNLHLFDGEDVMDHGYQAAQHQDLHPGASHPYGIPASISTQVFPKSCFVSLLSSFFSQHEKKFSSEVCIICTCIFLPKKN